MAANSDFKYEIIEELGVLSETPRGWTKELNKISWNGYAPKYDIREWAPDHSKMGKGVTLNDEEAANLYNLLSAVVSGGQPEPPEPEEEF
ncbi:MAG: YdbC family protein [Oscillospiraceae bacterium]|jgi:hypothetical protein|nr:YdbC family protein [Oscillospiraceae bacterium]